MKGGGTPWGRCRSLDVSVGRGRVGLIAGDCVVYVSRVPNQNRSGVWWGVLCDEDSAV